MTRTVVPARASPPGIAPLHFPPDAVARARIPDDATVWAFSDIHGVRSGLLAALVQAGLADIDGAWIAPPRTALVGLGDYVDRGTDSAGLVALLASLQREAAAAGSSVVLVRGNHEQMLADVLQGDDAWAVDWLSKGGDETVRSFGFEPDRTGLARFRDAVSLDHSELVSFVLDTLPYAVWRDTLFVHAAPPTGIARLEDLATSDEQMWHAATFLASEGIALDPAFEPYRAAGIGRVVLGHVPQPAGPTTLHDGTAILLDTNAAAPAKRGSVDWTSFVTLVRLGRGQTFDDIETIMIDTSTAPDRAPTRRQP
jgi:3',5'-cyclic AMP phosphodiesterase CpdA